MYSLYVELVTTKVGGRATGDVKWPEVVSKVVNVGGLASGKGPDYPGLSLPLSLKRMDVCDALTSLVELPCVRRKKN